MPIKSQMRHSAVAIAALAMLPFGGEQAKAQSLQATVAITVSVVAPLRVRAVEWLDFGTIEAGYVGQVAIGTDDMVSASAPGGCFAGSGEAHMPQCVQAHAGRYEVSGMPNASYDVLLPSSADADGQFLDGRAAPKLKVKALAVSTKSRSGNGVRGVLDDDGHDSFTLGGAIDMPGLPDAAHYVLILPLMVAHR